MPSYFMYIFAVCGVGSILLAGFYYLKLRKVSFISDLLSEKCSSEGVSIVGGPEDAFLETHGVRKRGVACITDFEVLFVPLDGTETVQIRFTDVRTFVPDENTCQIQTSDGRNYLIESGLAETIGSLE